MFIKMDSAWQGVSMTKSTGVCSALVLTLNMREFISVELGQYHGCWCPGSLRRKDISSHDIDYVEYVGPGLTWARTLSTCVISMWSNDIKCKYMFMFPLKNLARKELIDPMTKPEFCLISRSVSLLLIALAPSIVNSSLAMVVTL